MNTIHYLIIAGILLLTFATRALMDRRLLGRASLTVQRPWRKVRYVLSALLLAGYIAVDAAPKHGVPPTLIIVIAAVTALSGVGAMWAYYCGLEKADEFVLKIETEAMALAFTLSIFGLVGAGQLARLGIITEPGVLKVTFGMAISFGVSRLAVYARYR
jgi:hypothetical protein